MRSLITIFLIFISSSAFAGGKYVDFNSWQEARDYYDKNLAKYMAGVSGDSGYLTVLSKDNANYKRLEPIVEKLSAGYFKYFGSFRELCHPPYLLIINSNAVQASSVTNPVTIEKPNLFVINLGATTFTDQEIAGVIAHELGHFYLQYEEGRERFPKPKYYQLQTDRVMFGPEIKNNLVIQKYYRRYEIISTAVGNFANSELDGIPMSAIKEDTSNAQIYKYLLDHNITNSHCARANEISNDIAPALSLNYDSNTYLLHSEKIEGLADTSLAIENELTKCLGGIKMSLRDLVMQTFSLTKEQYDTAMATFEPDEFRYTNELASLFAKYSVIDAIFIAARAARKEMNEINLISPAAKMAEYGVEDQADEAGIYVMTQMSFNPDGLNEFLTTNSAPDEGCDLSHQPYYGTPDITHHTTCWRIYRNMKFAQYLRELSKSERDHYFSRLEPFRAEGNE